MAPETIDSLDAESLKPLVLQLLARIDRMLAQIAARDNRIDELLPWRVEGLLPRVLSQAA